MKPLKRKTMTAVKFRLVLTILMVIVVILMVGLFLFGYRNMQSVSAETAKRQADASASEDSVENLKRLQRYLAELDGVNEKLQSLRSSNTIPQFDTERSLRTIADQLGLEVRNITFIDGGSGSTEGSTNTTATPAATRSSKISFQFSRPISYIELIRFLDAIETSTPKLTLEGITIPVESTRNSIDPGTLTLELATN